MATTKLNPNRLKELETLSLARSGHPMGIKDGACVMEAVSYVAGEPWSDCPKCACPVLTRFAIAVNDRVDDATRQKLKPLVVRLAGSKLDRTAEIARARFLVYWSITENLPKLTDVLQLPEISAQIRAFKYGEWMAMRDYCRAQKGAIREAASKHANAAAAAAYTCPGAANAAAVDALAADAAIAVDAANAAAAVSVRWMAVKQSIWDGMVSALERAIDVTEEPGAG
jgi:hypothetical protein